MQRINLRKIINTCPQKVVIYIRVSTDHQEKSGLGLDAQLTLCENACKSHNLEVVGDFRDTASGRIHPEERPVFMEAVELAQRTGARLMVAKLDRLSRRIFHVSGYVDKEFFGGLTPDLIVAESPNMSQFEINVRAMIAQEEREMISQRTRAALAELKAQGVELGANGRKTATKKAREATSDAIAYAKELRDKGNSYQAIADQMNADGFTTSRGGNWYAANVRLRLKNI